MPTLPDLNITTRVNHSPHVVILGAGGSKAAFPRGDPNGRVVPVMQQLIECLDLTASLKAAGFADPTNFEAIYDELATTGCNPTLVNEIEGRVRKYFESMVLPPESTLYDRLILSVRETDLIATFNWDPFLPLSYARNAHIQRLPQLAFLHGNVEVAVCLKDRVTGFRWQQCQKCGEPLQPTKLLYPVRHKDYNADPFIANEWNRLKWFLDRAYMLTVFGYGAPATDVEAVDLMSNAWKNNPRFELGQVNVVDIRPQRQLEKTWEPFFCRNHYGTLKNLRSTWLFRYPRRSCEALAFATLQMAPWKTNRLPRFKSLAKLHKWIEPLIAEENAGQFTGNPCPMGVNQQSGSQRGGNGNRIKQTEAFARMLELMKVPVAERPEVMRGVDLFFDRGWPSNCFAVGMAARAGAGLVPPLYEGFGSEAKYKALMDAEDAKR